MTHNGLAKVLKFDDTQYELKGCKLVNNLVIPIKITFDQVISLLEAYCRTSLSCICSVSSYIQYTVGHKDTQ